MDEGRRKFNYGIKTSRFHPPTSAITRISDILQDLLLWLDTL
jgi:hypothetical protein